MADHTLPAFPESVIERITRWTSLKRWERVEVAQVIRAQGLSYSEIGALIPASRSSLSKWCRDVELTPEQKARLAEIRPSLESRIRVGSSARARALARTDALRESGRLEGLRLLDDPFWTAGTVAYWAEGAKTSGSLIMSNSDARMVRLFQTWCERYLEIATTRFTIRLHLHSGQDEDRAILFWSGQTCIPAASFGKSYVKPEGTGHRKNLLYNGTALVRVRRSGDLLHRVLGWIESLDGALGR